MLGMFRGTDIMLLWDWATDNILEGLAFKQITEKFTGLKKKSKMILGNKLQISPDIPWRRKWLPTPVFLPGKYHGQRNLLGYSPRGYKDSDTTEPVTHVIRYAKNIKNSFKESLLIRSRDLNRTINRNLMQDLFFSLFEMG